MPLEDVGSIDLLGNSDDGSQLVLMITDSGATPDPAVRLSLLRQKLATYMFWLTLPSSQKECTNYRNTLVKVVCADPPTTAMREIVSVDATHEDGTTQVVPVEFHLMPMTTL